MEILGHYVLYVGPVQYLSKHNSLNYPKARKLGAFELFLQLMANIFGKENLQLCTLEISKCTLAGKHHMRSIAADTDYSNRARRARTYSNQATGFNHAFRFQHK